MQIVVVDDEKESLYMFSSHVIDKANIQMQLFQKDYQAALDYIKTHDVYAAFLDIVMPDMNGIDFALKIIKLKPNIKIIFITGYFQNIEEIKSKLKDNLFAFCYKPYKKETMDSILVKLLEKDKAKIYFQTFSHFDCYVNDVLLDFDRAKAKELLALLVYRRGGEVLMEEAITQLWPEKDPKYSKKLYRDALCRLRLALRKFDIEHILNAKRGRISLNTKWCSSDYWGYLDGKNNSFHGEFLRPYEWSCDEENYLLSMAK